MGVKVGLVEYWNSAVVLEPLGLTVAFSVAPVAVTGEAAPVATVGDPCGVVNEPVEVPGTVPPALVATTRS